MNTNQSGLWTMAVGEREASLKAIEDAIAKRGGNPRQLFDRFRTDNIFTDKVAEFMLHGGIESSADLRIVRAIMGDRIFGSEEWSALYGARLPKRIPTFPWSKEVLKAPSPFHEGKTVAETHFAFLGLAKLNGKPLTINKWRELHPKSGQPQLYSDNPWYRNEQFANDVTCEFRWYLMPLEIVPNSERKTYQDQLVLLPAEYEVPTAIAEVTKDILAFRKTGTYVNPSRYGQVLDVSSFGFHVYVGIFGRGGLDVDDWDDFRFDRIGLAAARKSPA